MDNLLSPWQALLCEHTLTVIGKADLLERPLTAFFASRQCPGTAIRAAMDWALAQAKSKRVVISGFHSPLERSVLEVLLTAHAPAIVVLARDAATATLAPAWIDAIRQGCLVVASAVHEGVSQRLTTDISTERNDLVAAIAQHIVVAHAAPSGNLEARLEAWRATGHDLTILA